MTVRDISRETGIHRSSVSRIICKDLHLKCFKRRRAQELTDANCAARMKRAKLLLHKSRQYTTDFVSFMDEKVFSSRSLHPTIGRTKSVANLLRELLKKKFSVLFTVGTARSVTAWPPVNSACVTQLFKQLINTTLCSASLRKFVCRPLRCVPLQILTFYQNLVLVA